MFPLPTTRTMFDPKWDLYYVFTKASSFLLRNLRSALTRPNAMEGLVVVSYAKQLHLITSKARIELLLRGEGNDLY